MRRGRTTINEICTAIFQNRESIMENRFTEEIR